MPADDPEDELDGAVKDATGELYGLDPAEFVPARNELARRLRKAGDRALAAKVARLRRPNAAAWAVNQLARRHGPELAELVALGDALRTAQADALAGADAATLREAGRARRDAVAGLTQVALGLLAARGPGGEAHRAAIAATLEAASRDPEAAVAVTSGRLTSELAPLSGFGEAGSDDVEAPVARDGPAAGPNAEPAAGPNAVAAAEHGSREATEAEEAVASAAEESARAADAAGAASARAAELWRVAKEAQAVVLGLERDLDQAKRRLSDSQREAAAAERAAEEADAAADRAARRLHEARAAESMRPGGRG
jgi:hypothetical protein